MKKEAVTNTVRDMKKITLLFASAMLIMSACKPEVGPIGDRNAPGAGLIGTWELTNAEHTDVTLPVPETRDISSFYQRTTNKWRVQFNADSTYSVLSTGPGFDLFGNGGTWAYDAPDYPTELLLTQFDTVTTALPLGNMPRTIDPTLSIVYSRIKCGNPSITYRLTYTRQP